MTYKEKERIVNGIIVIILSFIIGIWTGNKLANLRTEQKTEPNANGTAVLYYATQPK